MLGACALGLGQNKPKNLPLCTTYDPLPCKDLRGEEDSMCPYDSNSLYTTIFLISISFTLHRSQLEETNVYVRTTDGKIVESGIEPYS